MRVSKNSTSDKVVELVLEHDKKRKKRVENPKKKVEKCFPMREFDSNKDLFSTILKFILSAAFTVSPFVVCNLKCFAK